MGHFRRHKSLSSSKAVFELLCQSQEDGEGRSSAIGQIWLQSPSFHRWLVRRNGRDIKGLFCSLSSFSVSHAQRERAAFVARRTVVAAWHGLTVRPTDGIAAIQREMTFLATMPCIMPAVMITSVVVTQLPDSSHANILCYPPLVLHHQLNLCAPLKNWNTKREQNFWPVDRRSVILDPPDKRCPPPPSMMGPFIHKSGVTEARARPTSGLKTMSPPFPMTPFSLLFLLPFL